ncbi:MAG: HNH endonuclease, partial [Candidatus Korobacteraceae bacterium]
EAEQQLTILGRLARKRPREVAQEELLRIVQQSARQPRPRVLPAVAERREGVPAGTRVLLRELHDGKCQICSFTFEKRNGEPYFEIHHLDPRIGHHPTNLLVVCPNCHAQLEHAMLGDFRWAGHWLVGLSINGKRLSVRQPLAHDSMRRALLGLFIVIATLRFGRLLGR